jgi:hypothetical protein
MTWARSVFSPSAQNSPESQSLLTLGLWKLLHAHNPCTENQRLDFEGAQ